LGGSIVMTDMGGVVSSDGLGPQTFGQLLEEIIKKIKYEHDGLGISTKEWRIKAIAGRCGVDEETLRTWRHDKARPRSIEGILCGLLGADASLDSPQYSAWRQELRAAWEASGASKAKAKSGISVAQSDHSASPGLPPHNPEHAGPHVSLGILSDDFYRGAARFFRMSEDAYEKARTQLGGGHYVIYRFSHRMRGSSILRGYLHVPAAERGAAIVFEEKHRIRGSKDSLDQWFVRKGYVIWREKAPFFISTKDGSPDTQCMYVTDSMPTNDPNGTVINVIRGHLHDWEDGAPYLVKMVMRRLTGPMPESDIHEIKPSAVPSNILDDLQLSIPSRRHPDFMPNVIALR